MRLSARGSRRPREMEEKREKEKAYADDEAYEEYEGEDEVEEEEDNERGGGASAGAKGAFPRDKIRLLSGAVLQYQNGARVGPCKRRICDATRPAFDPNIDSPLSH